MKLRPLAEGWQYLVQSLDGSRGYGLDHAPAECFADAAPQVEEPLKVGDRVVVVDNPTIPKGHDTPDTEWAGWHGTIISWDSTLAAVVLDSGDVIRPWTINLRRERPDERPTKPLETGYLKVALVDGRIQVSIEPAEGAK